MPFQNLKDRTVLTVSGPDATTFLQGLITANVETLEGGTASPAALLTPQGKIAFDFLISHPKKNVIYIDISRQLLDSFKTKLALYKLRADVEISERSDLSVNAIWDEDETQIPILKDLRFGKNAKVYRSYQSDRIDLLEGDFNEIRVANGIAESGSDFELSDIFPHDIFMDLNGGIDFQKGCFVGQEVVSRMKHRGTARKRVAIVESSSGFEPSSKDLTADGKSIGQIGSSIGNKAIAILRTDRLETAQNKNVTILLSGMEVTITFPDWAQQKTMDQTL